MRKQKWLTLSLVIASLVFLTGCDVWDMIKEDMLKDILSKFNPFGHLFANNGTTPSPPSHEQVAGAAAVTAGLVAILAAANGAFQGIVDFFSRGAQGAAEAGVAASQVASTEPASGEDLWQIIKRGGPDLEKLSQSIVDQKFTNMTVGTALPESINQVGAPPTWEDINRTLNEVRNKLTGTDSPDNWIDIDKIKERGTTVRAVIVGTIAMVGVTSLSGLSMWVLGIGVATGLLDKFGPDTIDMVKPFIQADKPKPEPREPGVEFPPVPAEPYPQLKREDLWKMPRADRLKMYEESRSWLQNLGGYEPPTTVEGWERAYESVNKRVIDYEIRAQEDPNLTELDTYKKWRYQRDLLDTLRASGPRMELQ
jgi:hypothetical protein